MNLSYDEFSKAFLFKIREYDFQSYLPEVRTEMVDRYMKTAMAKFRHVSLYEFSGTADDILREYKIVIDVDDLDEIVDIVSEGMVVQWLKPHVYSQVNYEQVLSTRDYTAYSNASLLTAIRSAYDKARKDFKRLAYDYSYDNGDVTDLNL